MSTAPEPRKPRPGRLAADVAEALAARAAGRVRRGLADARAQVSHGGRYRCAGCDKDFRGIRALNAHHGARHAGRWMTANARKAARRMGKETDRMRRHARGWLEASGLRDSRGQMTDRARTRPKIRGLVRIRDLRAADRHDRDHERADRLDGKAARQPGRPGRSARWTNKAFRLRGRHIPPPPARQVPRQDLPHPWTWSARPEPQRAGTARDMPVPREARTNTPPRSRT